MKASMREVRELHSQGCTDIEMAEILGVSHKTIKNRRELLGLGRNPTYRRFHKLYNVFDGKTGRLLYTGEAEECAAHYGMKTDSFRSLVSRSKSGKVKWIRAEVHKQ